jgi:hypothetical protein
VNDALNNVPKRGGLLRPKLARYIRQHFNNWERLLAALGWTEDGQIVPRGESHVEQNPAPRDCETLPGGEARDE